MRRAHRNDRTDASIPTQAKKANLWKTARASVAFWVASRKGAVPGKDEHFRRLPEGVTLTAVVHFFDTEKPQMFGPATLDI